LSFEAGRKYLHITSNRLCLGSFFDKYAATDRAFQKLIFVDRPNLTRVAEISILTECEVMAKKGAKRDGSKSQSIRDYLKANPGANSKVVKDDLAKTGLSVSEGLVNKVKYSKPAGKKTGGRKATTRKTAVPKRKATRRGRPAAGGVNMSDAIRDFIAANPSASRPEIRDTLQAQGVAVSNSLVNAVFMKVKKGGGKSAKRGPGRPKAAARPAAPASSGGNMSAAELINAKQLVDQLGGIAKVRDALSLLEQLQ
jgi:uncharacterized protein YneF (UPF0154 family)